MIEKIWLWWYGKVCVPQYETNTVDELSSLQNAVHPAFAATPAQRAPYGWCMGAIFVQKRWSRASQVFFSFFRGNSSCLAALIQAGWLYLHTYCGKEACSNSRKGSRFVFSRSETSWCNQLQLGLSCTGARCSMPLSVAHHMVSRAMETHVTRSLKIWLTNQNRQY